MYAYPDPDGWQVTPSSTPIVVNDRGRDRDRCATGSGGMILLQFRRSPKCHQRVADVLVYRAALGLHAGGEQPEMVIEERRRIGRRQPLGKAREVDNVGEQHRDVPLNKRCRLFALRHQLLDQASGHVGLEPVQDRDERVVRADCLVQFAKTTAGERAGST